MIRPARRADGEAIREIYNYYIENTAVSFEETPVAAAEMEERIQRISARYPFFVWEENGGGENKPQINGYAYVNTWREKSAYRRSAEVSIYLRNGFQRRGIGGKLMEKLLDEVRKTEIHTLVSGITLPNESSAALHEKFGFKQIARFKEIGFKFNKRLDVGYWQLILGGPVHESGVLKQPEN